MSKQLNIRDIPPRVQQWLKTETAARGVKQNELLLSLLERAASGEITPGLFDQVAAPTSPTLNAPDSLPFTFIDLFAGIGGFRLALERCGGRCVFTSEWDKNSQRTYKKWFGDEHVHGDITKIQPTDIPNHAVLAAGFPCQPFSIAGVSKKNSLGRAHGFKCDTQGTLFYNIATIMEAKRPPVVILENVKNLLGHDKGKTWKVIHSTLTELRYTVFHKVIDAAAYVPQHRERVYVVAFDSDRFGPNPPFEYPQPPNTPKPKFRDILDPNPPEKYTLTDHLWNYLQKYAEGHRAKGNGFGFGMTDLDGVSRTLSARYYKDGSEVLIPQPGKNPRRLTPRECARLMGYPDHLPIEVSDTQAYRQFGNSLVPAIAEAVGRQVVKVLCWYMRGNGRGCLLEPEKLSA